MNRGSGRRAVAVIAVALACCACTDPREVARSAVPEVSTAGSGSLTPSPSPSPSPTTPVVPTPSPTPSPSPSPVVPTSASPTPPPPTPTPTPTAPVVTAPSTPRPDTTAVADVRDADLYAITCTMPESAVAASGAPRVRQGGATVYTGARQVSGDNQDPVVVRFDDGRRTWCRDDLERSGDDGRGYGLFWSGDVLLGVFSAVGTQGEPSGDLRRFTGSGWLASYADASPRGGGGPKVAAVVALDPATGSGRPGVGTWLTALNNGAVNSLLVTSVDTADGGLRIGVRSWFAPRGADRRALSCTGGSPFDLVYTFDADLRSVTGVDGAGRCG